eukprot:442451_1
MASFITFLFIINVANSLTANTWHTPSFGTRSYLYQRGCFDWVSHTQAINQCKNNWNADTVAALSTTQIWNWVTTTLITSNPTQGSHACASWWGQTFIIVGAQCSGSPSSLVWFNGDTY